MTALSFEHALRSNVGRRANNEDAVFASPRLAAVADGVGGAAAGEVASRAIIDGLVRLDKARLQGPLDEALTEAVAWGNQVISLIVECRPHMAGMSTTLTAIALGDDGSYVSANIGDSRTYLFRDRMLRQLTRDDSFVQHLIDSGQLTIDEAREHPQRSLVLEALDGSPARRPVLQRAAARVGDRLLLCSDGISDVLGHDEMTQALGRAARRACADDLVNMALAAGGRDNLSVVVADVVPRRDPEAGW